MISNDFHCPFHPVPTIRHALAEMAIQVMQQQVPFQQNPGVVPLIRLHLHDYHVTRLRWTIKLTEPAFIPAVLIKIVRIHHG